MSPLTLWEPDTTLKTISGIEPRLASWNKAAHPDQIRLREYLQLLWGQLLPLPAESLPFFLHLDVDVGQPAHLLRHHDLENYLTPLFGLNGLPASRFALVSARKFIGGGSKLELGVARPASEALRPAGWHHFSHSMKTMEKGKVELRNALAAAQPQPLTRPEVEVQIAWRCSSRRNWRNLWKPTGDCMGPVLGEQNPRKPFSPDDDRIVALKFHRTLDETMGDDVHLEMWWRVYTT